MRLHPFIFFIILLFPHSLHAQDSLLNARVAALEEVISLEKTIEEKVAEEAERQRQNFWIGAVVAVVAFLGGYGGLYLWAKKYAQSQVEQKIATIIEEKRELIRAIAAGQEREYLLLQNTRILVLSFGSDFDHGSPAGKVLGKFARQNLSPVTLAAGAKVSVETYDLVFVDNGSGHFDTALSLVEEYLQTAAGSGVAFFYFGGKHLNPQIMQQHELAGSANFPSQIYGNMMNLLKLRALPGSENKTNNK
ncbi:MAG: hypothetical protein R3D00_19880 [Bacteroidia bacterium]